MHTVLLCHPQAKMSNKGLAVTCKEFSSILIFFVNPTNKCNTQNLYTFIILHAIMMFFPVINGQAASSNLQNMSTGIYLFQALFFHRRLFGMSNQINFVYMAFIKSHCFSWLYKLYRE